MSQDINVKSCSICGSEGVTQTTCPLNPSAKNPSYSKHPNVESFPYLVATEPAARLGILASLDRKGILNTCMLNRSFLNFCYDQEGDFWRPLIHRDCMLLDLPNLKTYTQIYRNPFDTWFSVYLQGCTTYKRVVAAYNDKLYPRLYALLDNDELYNLHAPERDDVPELVFKNVVFFEVGSMDHFVLLNNGQLLTQPRKSIDHKWIPVFPTNVHILSFNITHQPPNAVAALATDGQVYLTIISRTDQFTVKPASKDAIQVVVYGKFYYVLLKDGTIEKRSVSTKQDPTIISPAMGGIFIHIDYKYLLASNGVEYRFNHLDQIEPVQPDQRYAYDDITSQGRFVFPPSIQGFGEVVKEQIIDPPPYEKFVDGVDMLYQYNKGKEYAVIGACATNKGNLYIVKYKRGTNNPRVNELEKITLPGNRLLQPSFTLLDK